MKYVIEFNAKRVGAIGRSCRFSVLVEAPDPDTARMKLYEDYEHISIDKIRPLEEAR